MKYDVLNEFVTDAREFLTDMARALRQDLNLGQSTPAVTAAYESYLTEFSVNRMLAEENLGPRDLGPKLSERQFARQHQALAK